MRLTWLPGASWLWFGLAGRFVGAEEGRTWPFLLGAIAFWALDPVAPVVVAATAVANLELDSLF